MDFTSIFNRHIQWSVVETEKKLSGEIDLHQLSVLLYWIKCKCDSSSNDMDKGLVLRRLLSKTAEHGTRLRGARSIRNLTLSERAPAIWELTTQNLQIENGKKSTFFAIFFIFKKHTVL